MAAANVPRKAPCKPPSQYVRSYRIQWLYESCSNIVYDFILLLYTIMKTFGHWPWCKHITQPGRRPRNSALRSARGIHKPTGVADELQTFHRNRGRGPGPQPQPCIGEHAAHGRFHRYRRDGSALHDGEQHDRLSQPCLRGAGALQRRLGGRAGARRVVGIRRADTRAFQAARGRDISQWQPLYRG